MFAAPWLLLLTSFVQLAAQGNPVQAFSPEEIAIYRALLLRYPLEPGDLSRLEPYTVAFLPGEAGARSELKDVHVIAPSHRGRLLPPEILALGEEHRVAHLAAARGRLLPPSKRVPGLRWDGSVITHFSLSEIAFDAEHHFAEVVFRADCGCLGGEGGTALFEHTPKGWKLLEVADVWEG